MQRGEFALHHIPNDFVVHVVVAVDQAIAQPDDAMEVGNLRRERRFGAAGLVQRFADDLELPLDTGAEQAIRLISGKVFAGDEFGDCLARADDIKQPFSRLVRRR